MDSGRGEFMMLPKEMVEQLDEVEKDALFTVGEEVTIKNSRFRVVLIGKKFMKLKLLPKWQQEPA